MHLARASVLLRPRPHVGTAGSQLRFASHGAHAREEHSDTSHYNPEAGFSTPFWRNTLLLSLAAVAFYKWAPSRDEDTYLTRWIAYYSTPEETWASLNEKHLLQSQEATDNTTLQARATRPGILRYRYPQSLDQSSPHLVPVGSVPDIKGIKMRTD